MRRWYPPIEVSRRGWLVIALALLGVACDSHGLQKSSDAGAVSSGGTGGSLCTDSSQCPSPQVCNFNTDMKCGPAVYTQVDVSDEFTCAVVSDGTLRCWGINNYGQLGVASTNNQLAPIQVPGLSNVQMVAIGWRYTCALLWDGQVNCWGYNVNGSLGCPAPATIGSALQCTPYPQGALVDGIIAGGERACALLADSTVQCWGRNNHYQVGDGTNVSAFSPATVVSLADITAVASGLWQACAITLDGAAWCWGANDRGQLGNGTYSEGPSPTNASGLDGIAARVTAAAVGEGHSCFLLEDGSLRCTGDDNYGQLGDGGVSRSKVPIVATQFPPPSQLLAVGFGFTCVLGGDHSLRCVGAGSQGQLGNGTSATSQTPVVVSLPDGVAVAAVAAHCNHACVLSTDGRLWCWGSNSAGQLGNGTQVDSNVPVGVPAPARN
jgi:alpha-tubulin suppressor-like RCC1 family protein